jgi:hypothetical protein
MEQLFAAGRSRAWWTALVALAALISASCVGSAASNPATVLPTAGLPASASVTASLAPTAAAIDLSNVPLAPAGTWKSIHWVAVPAMLNPTPPPPTDPPTGLFGDWTVSGIFGWSRGYVGLSLETTSTGIGSAGAVITTTTYSGDGVHWHAGATFVQHSIVDNLVVDGVFEGPTGLLAVEEAGACGDHWVEGLLTSPDGVTWQPVDMAGAFGTAVILNVSGGSTGFVAVDAAGRAAWTSRDGRAWQPLKLDAAAFATSRIDDGTAFSAGFVLAGSTQDTGAVNCNAPFSPKPPLRVPAVWWSADGTDWIRSELPGARDADQPALSVRRLGDQTLAVFESWDGAEHAWVSTDGRTWTPLAEPLTLDRYFDSSSCDRGCFKTDGRHGIQIQPLNREADNDRWAGGASLSTWTDSGLVTLDESGEKPLYDLWTEWTVGPTGIVVTVAGQVWIGLPSTY